LNGDETSITDSGKDTHVWFSGDALCRGYHSGYYIYSENDLEKACAPAGGTYRPSVRCAAFCHCGFRYYPVLAAAYFQPWQKDPILFCYVGVGPVVLGWLLFWVASGFRRK